VSDAGVQGLRDLIPHARSVLVPGAGHMVAGDENDRFMEAVIDFVMQGRPGDDAAQRG
jgi:pimeloyl-ACP methyl ester carboxylesterase